MKKFTFRDQARNIWAEIRRDDAGKLTLMPNRAPSGLFSDHRLYVFDTNGKWLQLNPTGDGERFYINCANDDGLIIINLDYSSNIRDILGLEARSQIKLRYFAGSPDYFRLILE